jgi:5-methylcytosine-specific restriction endonuclease McrA
MATDEQIKEAVKKSRSMAEASRIVGMPFTTFKHRAKRLGLYITNQSGKGMPKKSSIAIPLDQILVENSTYANTSNLKKKLINAGLIENQCSECGLKDKWNGKEIVLQLDHENGDRLDNRIENLRLMCPNCHSQTDTFCRKKSSL